MHPLLALAFFSALSVTDSADAQVAITILHSSEHHGTIQPIEHGPFAGLGGVERRAALIKQVRQEVEHLLVVDSGDLLTGTALSSVYRGEAGLIGKKNYPDTFNRAVVQEVEFVDPIVAAKQAVEELRERVEILVALTHQDTEEDLALAKAVPGLDVIIGGHTEGFDGLVPPGQTKPVEGRVELTGVGPVFVKTHRQGRTLGRLDLLYYEK